MYLLSGPTANLINQKKKKIKIKVVKIASVTLKKFRIFTFFFLVKTNL